MQKLVSFVALIVLAIAVSVNAKGSPLLGITKTLYNGSMVATFHDSNGYDDARLACISEFNNGNAHVCTTHELSLIAQSQNIRLVAAAHGVRFIDLSFGMTADGNVADDCHGFTTDKDTSFSRCVLARIGGPALPAFCSCNNALALACCQ